MFGWTGKILHLDLHRQRWDIETPDEGCYRGLIGGRGLAVSYLRERVRLPWDDPDMPLLFFTGPLVNTPAPTSGRMAVVSRSPLTGTVGDSSAGGAFGTRLKRAGFDGMVVCGRSPRPCGIEIDHGHVTIVDATALSGEETASVRRRYDSSWSTAVIGPAAESGVRFAGIVIDGHHAAGRGGLGLVMAAKNLKYIAVRGGGRTPVYDRKEVLAAREDVLRLVAASPVLMGRFGIANYGTAALYDLMDARRMMPTDNFRRTRFEAAPALNAPAMHQRFHPSRSGCSGCHIRCKQNAADGRRLPEFETLSHFSALLGNRDLDAVLEANRLCNALGMDTISAGATLACYAEISGVTLTPQRLLARLQDIGRGRGPGAELGQGAQAYARHKGRSEAAMTVKGLELPAYDPRGAYGMALAYATSTRGGCHLKAYPISHEILRKPVATDRFSFIGKARAVKVGEDANAVADSLTACKFTLLAASLEEYARVYGAVTGHALGGQELLRIGEKIYYQERILNAQNGFDRRHDDLPQRFFSETGYRGADVTVGPLPREAFEQALEAYYQARGLDGRGRPVAAKARSLGLKLDAPGQTAIEDGRDE